MSKYKKKNKILHHIWKGDSSTAHIWLFCSSGISRHCFLQLLYLFTLKKKKKKKVPKPFLCWSQQPQPSEGEETVLRENGGNKSVYSNYYVFKPLLIAFLQQKCNHLCLHSAGVCQDFCLSDWLTHRIRFAVEIFLHYINKGFELSLWVRGGSEQADKLTNPRLLRRFAFLRCNFFLFLQRQCSWSRCQNLPRNWCCGELLLHIELMKAPFEKQNSALVAAYRGIALNCGARLFPNFSSREVIGQQWKIHVWVGKLISLN